MPNLAVRSTGEAMPAAKRAFNFHPDQLPPEYAMIAEGDCLLPAIPSGTKLLFSRAEPCRPGDYVVLYIRPDLVQPGDHQATVKRLKVAPPPWATFGEDKGGETAGVVIVEMFNPPRLIIFKTADLQGMHRCLGPVPETIRTYMMTDDEVAARRGEPS